MKVSVVLATYNGRDYVEEQMLSILEQTRLADEVLICDDRSTDDTVEVVKSFITKHDVQNTWRVIVNSSNLGHPNNFISGVEQACGDIIFFSDQDDRWNKKKIEFMTNGFASHEDMLACYCLENYIDEQGNDIKSRFRFTRNPNANKKGFSPISFIDSVKYNKCPGLCLAVKREVMLELAPMIRKYDLGHDLIVGTYVALRKGLYCLDEELVDYRQHTNNVSKPKLTVMSRIQSIDHQISGRELRYNQFSAFNEVYHDKLEGKEKEYFEDCIRNTYLDMEYLKKRDVIKLIGQLFNTNPMMNKWISLNNIFCAVYARLHK